MATKHQQIIIGGGAMGLATAWQLAKRGTAPLLLEQFEFGHTIGASHGTTRNLNNAYTDEHYLDLYDEAFELYRELEDASGIQLLTVYGLVSFGDPKRVGERYEKLRSRGETVELLEIAEAEKRWPGMRFDGKVMLSHKAGRIASERVLEVLAEQARREGADLRANYRVVDLTQTENGVIVTAVGPSGAEEQFHAESVVSTAGAWTSKLIGTQVRLPKLTVTEEHPAHFQPTSDYQDAEWPSFNHFIANDPSTGKGDVYGMLTPGEGVKVGFHYTGPEVDPDNRSFHSTEAARQELRSHVSQWFPGLDVDSAEEISCTYTTADNLTFIMDRRERITVGAGFAGEGFKFVPAVGRVLAGLALGEDEAREAFALPG